jgi:hypothetical protein
VALKDLLWACPLCARLSGIRRSGKHEECAQCGTTFRRGSGASIIALAPGREPIAASVPDWLAMLPPFPELPEDPAAERVIIRRVRQTMRVLRDGALLGWAERFGKRVKGTLALNANEVRMTAEDATAVTWALEHLVAIQPSSTSLQLRARGGAPISVSFLDASVLLWERWLQDAVQRRWRDLGRGEVHEFQPRIE